MATLAVRGFTPDMYFIQLPKPLELCHKIEIKLLINPLGY